VERALLGFGALRMKSIDKKLFLIRHAHRDTETPSRDNGLSEKGLSQVKRLVPFLADRVEGDIRCLSSPKKRCRETLEPVAESCGVRLEIDERLGEAGPFERKDEVLARLDSFISEWQEEGAEILLACSHGDIIPLLVERLTGARIGIKKCGVVEIDLFAGECFLMGLVQKPGS
jgi:broad specificity phosphatase PhoE